MQVPGQTRTARYPGLPPGCGSQTAVAPFSTRAKDGCTCAVPVSWDELKGLPAANVFGLTEAAAHAAAGDPWPDYFAQKAPLTKKMMTAVGAEI